MSGKSVILFLLFLLLFPAVICQGEEASDDARGTIISIELSPGAEVPVGDNSDYFDIGGSVVFRADVSPEPAPFISILGDFFYMLNPYGTEQFFTSYGGGGGLGYNIELGSDVRLQAFAAGGYSSSILQLAGQSIEGGGAYVTGGIAGKFNFGPLFSAGLKIFYRDIFGVYSGISASLSASLDLDIKSSPGAAGSGPVEGNFIKLLDINYLPVFPVFYSYYDEHPMGSAVLYNPQDKPVSDITVTLYVNKYMDAPKQCAYIEEIPAGESSRIDLRALFTENMLEITEGMKVAAEITADYKYGNTVYRDSNSSSMEIEFRNGMTWDDDRKAAAFITAKDPDILSTSKNIAGLLKEITEYSINPNLVTAMAFHETLRLYGLSYVIDPSTPYENMSRDELTVDYLQFPRETLEYRAGDCDDLSILYCALFESVGIETAFVTVPGHIFMAFSLGMDQQEAEKTFSRPEDLIFRNGTAWVPFEITCLEDDFLKAWQLGAKEWREYKPAGETGFFRVHEAWKTYKPIGLPGREVKVSMPPADMVSDRLASIVKTYVEREIFPQVSQYETKIAGASGIRKIRDMNKLGVLYARYGLEEKALQEFQKILLIQDFVPALINIGNIYFIEKDMDQALPYYQKALKLDPENKKALLYAATVNHELENYAEAEEIYSKLKIVDAGFAEEFAYLNLRGEDGSRASGINKRQVTILWDEE